MRRKTTSAGISSRPSGPSISTEPGPIRTTSVSKREAIAFSAMRFSMSGLTQYLIEPDSRSRRWTRVTKAPARKSASAASAAELLPPTTTTLRRWHACGSSK